VARHDGRTIVPSSDAPTVIALAGTLAHELAEQVGSVDTLVVPIGGGGLAAGCVIAISDRRTRVIGVEPRTGDDTHRSLRNDRRVCIPPPRTIADGLRHQVPGILTFEIMRRLLDRVVLVTDEEIITAMRLLHSYFGVVAEPSGACALAAVLAGRVSANGRGRIAVVVSGGNISERDAQTLMYPVSSS
jgi:threonine dehydratase